MSLITVGDAKAHMNITTEDDDLLIADKIIAAEEWLSEYMGVDIWDVQTFPNGTPNPLKEAVRQLVAHWYENREATLIGMSADEIPFGVCDLVAPYREYVF